MTVSLLEILAAARTHAAPLAAESAGYLLLGVADQVLTAPRPVTPSAVELSPDGTVRLRPPAGAPPQPNLEQAVRRLLARTLEVSSSVGPALRRAAERRDETGLGALVRELEAALIPVNRAAARRALSRLHRETERALASGRLTAALAAETAKQASSQPEAEPLVAEPLPAVAPRDPAPSPVVERELATSGELHEAEAAAPVHAARRPAPAPEPPLTLTPPPRQAAPSPQLSAARLEPSSLPPPAVGEVAVTKPEPVVERRLARGSSTPRLGTVVTAQTLPGEEQERTQRTPAVMLEASAEPPVAATTAAVADEPQPLLDPEPSLMPDVVSAMVALHARVEEDEAPTRLRDVVTSARVAMPSPVSVMLTPEPELVEDSWLTESSLVGVESALASFEEPALDPAVHEAVTWNPGAVTSGSVAPASATFPRSPALVDIEPAPYAPAVLKGPSSDVSELLDSFYVSAAAEERELCSALKEIAGLSLTPLPKSAAGEG